ncbi:protein CutA homolog isoform 2-T2 [Menidia menidia]
MCQLLRSSFRVISTSRTLGMTVITTKRVELLLQRCHKEALSTSAFRSVLLISCSSIGVQLHALFTGRYVPGYYSILLINSPNEQAAKDISRAVMERRLAASINIHSRTSTMYYWKGEIQDASEFLMLVKTKTSKIQQVVDYVRSVHPYANPEVLSFSVEDGSLAYMKWMDEAIPDD